MMSNPVVEIAPQLRYPIPAHVAQLCVQADRGDRLSCFLMSDWHAAAQRDFGCLQSWFRASECSGRFTAACSTFRPPRALRGQGRAPWAVSW